MIVMLPSQKVKRPCPDCGAPLTKRDSRMMSALIARTLIICKNITCGATFTGFEEIVYRLSPPSNPNPNIKIPMSPHAVKLEIIESVGLVPKEKENSNESENAKQ